jgi:superfamily II DNA or RNA helicase
MPDELLTVRVTRDHFDRGAMAARCGASDKVRERILVSHTINSAIRDFFQQTFGVTTNKDQSTEIKFSELLDVNRFTSNDWSLDVRVLMNVDEPAVYVPTLPLIVGFVSDFYIFVKAESTLSTVEILGFISSDQLEEADLSANGLMAIYPLDDLRPWNELKACVQVAKHREPQETLLFEEWHARAANLSATVEQVLLAEEAFQPGQVELLVASFRDEILRVYGQHAVPVPIQAIYDKLAHRFNLTEPIRSHPESPLIFANPEKVRPSVASPETDKRFFQEDLNVSSRAQLYRYLIESDQAFEEHRQLKSILDHATGGKLHSPKRRQEHIRKKREIRAAASEETIIPPPITDPLEKADLDEWFAEFQPDEKAQSVPSPDLGEPARSGGWETFPFKTEYRTGYDDLVKDFYHPALAGARDYWRAVGFFSSSALEAVGRPLGEFVVRGGRMRLITSVNLSDQDYAAIAAGTQTESVVELRLLEEIGKDFEEPLGKGAELLLNLLEAGLLEIKIAVPVSGPGIFHEKVGIFLAPALYIAFSGSMNESRYAFENNYECVDVFTSWKDESRAESKKGHFERLWDNVATGVTTFSFPEAAKKELIRISGIRKSQPSEPSRSLPIKLWSHQEEAVSTFLKKGRGILEMATGTGKTKTSLEICRRLFEDGQIQTVIVSADGDDLLDQWYKELLTFVKQLGFQIPVLRHYKNHRERDRFFLNKSAIILTSRHFLPAVLYSLSEDEGAKSILIHDEVHRLGSPSNREKLAGMSDKVRFRLGLSATPDREYDDEGNAFVLESVGEVIYSFGLEDAIRRSILSPFEYIPLEYIASEEDKSRLQQVHKKAAARKQAGEPMTQEEIWIELARVHKTSRAKLPVFADFIEANLSLLRRCIIFVETREYGDEVLSIVHKHRHDFHVYYANEDSEVLKLFANGDIECLITCHRLSEGIDIHSLETVVLFSSSKARLETIQRIGRCLRKNPQDPSKQANVVDFIRTPDVDSGEEPWNSDLERRDWLKQLSSAEPDK